MSDVTMATADTAAAMPVGQAARLAHLVQQVLDRAIAIIATTCLVVMIVIVGAGVVARYIFNLSFSWSEEVSIWLFLFIIFLGVPLSISRDMSLSLGGLQARLRGTALATLMVLNEAVVAYVLAVLGTGAVQVVERVGGVTPVLALPMWLPYAVIVPATIAALVFLLVRLDARGRLPWRPLLSVTAGIAAYLILHRWELVILPDASPSLVAGIAFLVTLLMGVPIPVAMLFGVFLARLFGAPIPEAGIVQQTVTGASKFLLLAIPFFLTAGMLMNIGGLATRLMDFATTLVGHLRGGVGQVNIVFGTLFSGISGSSISQAAIAGKMIVPGMVRSGYPKPVACAQVAATSVIDNIIPPAIALLLVAASVNLSVGDLWIAGILPGLVLALSLMAVTYILARRNNYGGTTPRAPVSAMLRGAVDALPVLLLIVVILGGIRFGVVTPTESGVLAVAYALFLGLFVYRAYTLRGLAANLAEAAVETAMVGFVIGVSAPFAFIFIAERIPQDIVALVDAHIDSRFMMLLLVNLVLIFFGMVLDIGVGLLLLTPMLMPLAIQFGVDPIHFGIIVTVNLMLGGLTPPVGILVYVVSSVTGEPADRVFRAVWPFFLAMLSALILICAWPGLSLMMIR